MKKGFLALMVASTVFGGMLTACSSISNSSNEATCRKYHNFTAKRDRPNEAVATSLVQAVTNYYHPLDSSS